MKKIYKKVQVELGEITIYGSNRTIPLQYAIPWWNKEGEEEECFIYRKHRYFLSEFMHSDGMPFGKEFHGYAGDSFFSGVLIILCEDKHGNEAVKAFTYIC